MYEGAVLHKFTVLVNFWKVVFGNWFTVEILLSSIWEVLNYLSCFILMRAAYGIMYLQAILEDFSVCLIQDHVFMSLISY